MKSKRFYVKNLGEFDYVTTLISIDHPETFVARRTGSTCDLFIFDEIKVTDNSITWVASRISVYDFDDLNKGKRTLNSCFYGPRRGKKQGYLVKSIRGQFDAESILIDDMSQYVSQHDVYVPQFIDESHGSSLLSLATGKAIMSLVINDEECADPFVELDPFTSNITKGKVLFNSLPLGIDVMNRACVQSNQSVVINFEISDAKNEDSNPEQGHFEEMDNFQPESVEAITCLKKAFESGEDNEKLVSALYNNKNAVKKFNGFVSSISKNKNHTPIIQFIEPSSKSITKISLEPKTIKTISKNAKESLKLMSDNKKTGDVFNKNGYFEMYDISGMIHFKFKDLDGNKYRGVASNEYDKNKCHITVDEKYKYLVRLRPVFYVINGKNTQCTYELINVEKEMMYENVNIF